MKLSQIFTKPENWTQNCLARDKGGRAVSLDIMHYENGNELNLGQNAKSFSIYGAIANNFNVDARDIVTAKLRDAIKWYTKTNLSIGAFNDSPETKFEDVVAVIKEAGV